MSEDGTACDGTCGCADAETEERKQPELTFMHSTGGMMDGETRQISFKGSEDDDIEDLVKHHEYVVETYDWFIDGVDDAETDDDSDPTYQ